MENHRSESVGDEALLGRLAPIGLCLLDRDLRFVSLNEQMAAIDERQVDDHQGRTIAEMYPADLVELLEPACRRVLETSEPVDAVEYTGPVVGGDSRHWLVSIRPVAQSSGSPAVLHLAVKEITLRKQREQSGAEQLLFEQLISNISSRFVHVSSKDVDESIENALRDVAAYLDVEQASLALFARDGSGGRTTHSYAVGGVVPHPISVEIGEHLPYYWSVVASEKVFRFSSVSELPEEAVDEREYVAQEGISSVLTIPVPISDTEVGGISFTAFRKQREWPDHLVSRLRLVGELFVKALVHQRAELELAALHTRLESENVYLREEINLHYHHGEIIGRSRAIRGVLKQAEQVAPTDSTVLITGETGTGKELVARAIHKLGRRRERTMICVNCASLPMNLVESELFGRERGAYTGALTSQAGRFELADGSTIFLDEVGELPLDLQAKLLRVLQEGEFERLGSTDTRVVDVRVIAASNRNLELASREGEFREDLFYRLNVFPIDVPPLQERREDIPQLVWAFVTEFGQKLGKSVETISQRTMDDIQAAPWPGNIRELRNVIERAMIINDDPELRVTLPRTADTGPAPEAENLLLAEVERRHILLVLKSSRWRVSGRDGAAERLGLKPTTLEARMRKLGIRRPR